MSLMVGGVSPSDSGMRKMVGKFERVLILNWRYMERLIVCFVGVFGRVT